MPPTPKKGKPGPESVEQLAAKAAKPGGTKARRSPVKSKRRVSAADRKRSQTLAARLKRAQQIVIDRDRDWMAWTEIGAKHGVTEKTAREHYRDYIDEIAPLLKSEIPMEVGHELLRKLQGVEQRIAAMADTTDSENIKLGALNSLARMLHDEVELRQHLGLLPKKLGDVHVISDQLWAAEQIIAVLREMDAPPDAYRRVAEVLNGSANSH